MDGKIIGQRYEIVRQIGAGGSARVYLARDLVLKRDVAVKVLHEEGAQDPAFVKRFQREAQSAARLNHPNIVSVYDWGEVGSTYYMVMEAVGGHNLKEEIARRGPLTEAEALTIAEQVASALEAAHGKGVIHRDIKPQNILLDGAGRVKVADFGIARATGMTQLTATNVVAGTANYISPEQARGQPVDERSDIYSLGVLLWELLAGHELFNGRSMVEIALRHLNDVPPPLRQIRPDISPLTEAVVAKALAKDPGRRYQSAAAMREALASALDALSKPLIARTPLAQADLTVAVSESPRRRPAATEISAPSRGRPAVKREAVSHGWLAALLALVFLIAGGGALLAAERGPLASSAAKNTTATTPTSVAAARSKVRQTPRAVVQRASTAILTATPTPVPARTKAPAVPAPPVARSAPQATSTPIPPTSTLPAPTPIAGPPASSALAANTPQAAVQAFYTLVSHHQFQQAAQLWTPSMRAQSPPATYINGRFSNTSRINILELKPLSETANTATVQVDLLEVITEPTGTQTKQYAGTWSLVREPNGWLLNYPNLSQA